MTNQNSYENYPVWIPLLSVLQSLVIYIIGAHLLSGFGRIIVLFYLLFCLWSEYRVMGGSCRNCYYFGKLCGLGKGMIAPLFFKKGDPAQFIARNIGWKELIPDMLVFLVPLVGGIIWLFIRFNLITIGLMILLVILAMPCSGYMRGCLLCPNCKQRELGCPAQKLFGKEKR
jgi:hypothetical protein